MAKRLSKEIIAEKGEKIYQEKLKSRLEKYPGKIVAIEIESGEYFLGKTPLEVSEKATAKYPGRIFYLLRIGYPAVDFVRKGSP